MNCVICGKEFVRKNWIQNTCSQECRKKRRRITLKKHQLNNPILYRKSAKKYYDSHKEQIIKHIKKRNEQFKFQVLNHYGDKCVCCGESHEEFLTIDHINGGGNKHRKKFGISRISEWLVKNNYPEGFQVLCMNCNFIKGTHNKPFCKVHHPELYK